MTARKRMTPKVKPSARTPKAAPARVRLLSGDNPQIPQGEGNAPVQAYLAAIPDWKRAVARRLDALITRAVPGVRKAVKWNSPFYGLPERGWLVSFHVFERYVKVTFFNGRAFVPPVPGGTAKDARWIDIHENDLDEKQLRAWISQAAALPGWGKVQDTTMAKSAPTNGRSPAELIDERIASFDDWRGKTLAALRAVITGAETSVVEEWKWGGPVWSSHGIICTGETYKTAVKLTFAKGASLKDPAKLFNSSLEGNTRRAIDVREGETIDAKALKALVREAVALNAAGTKKR